MNLTKPIASDFGLQNKWRDQLLKASEAGSLQVRADSVLFNAAYDDGTFGAA